MFLKEAPPAPVFLIMWQRWVQLWNIFFRQKTSKWTIYGEIKAFFKFQPFPFMLGSWLLSQKVFSFFRCGGTGYCNWTPVIVFTHVATQSIWLRSCFHTKCSLPIAWSSSNMIGIRTPEFLLFLYSFDNDICSITQKLLLAIVSYFHTRCGNLWLSPRE